VNHRKFAIAARTLLQRASAAELLDALNREGVPVIVLKGLALLDRVYSGVHRRPMGDVDLLVRPDHFPLVTQILERQGYAFWGEDLGCRKAFTQEFMGEIPYRRDTVMIDLHWHLVTQHWYRQVTRIDFDGLWERALPLHITGSQALRLSPEDELLHLAFHAALHHGLGHTRGRDDILQILAKQPEIDWAAFVERAKQWKVRQACWITLYALNIVDATVVPQNVLDELQGPRWRRKRLETVLKRAPEGEAALASGSMRFLGILLVDDLWDLPKVILRGVFPGSRWLELRFDLSKRQAFRRQFSYPIEILMHGIGALSGK
jgi:hypothetical protein